jgi:Ca2+-binding RTX toxin-like protein
MPKLKPLNKNYIIGTDQNDVIIGTTEVDFFFAGDGDDLLVGGKGNDWYYGGKGNDHVYVQDAGDVVVEYADEGTDTVYSFLTNYTLGDNVEGLYLMGDAMNGTGNGLNNHMTGNDKNNGLLGLDGDDYIDGGKGADVMAGGIGDDQYCVDNPGDIVFELGGQGIDSVTSSISYKLLATLENLTLELGAGAINGTGNDADNILLGNESANILKGGAGEDQIYGFGGKDKMYGGAGDDYIQVDSTDDIVIEYTGEGYDTVFAKSSYVNPLNVEHMILDGLGTMVALGNSQDNSILGNTGDTIMFGGGGDDTLHGFYGNDKIDGGAGQDRLFGGQDNDTLTGGIENDTFMFIPNCGHDIVTDFTAGDVIEFRNGAFSDFAGVQAAMQQVGGDTLITLDGNTSITLQGVDMSSLQASDFQFV